jgi:conjugal transfer/entry exclusion protein
MADKELKFFVSTEDFKATIGNMTGEVNDYIDEQYRDRLKETLKEVFNDLLKATEDGLSGRELEKVIEDALLSLSDMIIPGLSDILVAVTTLTQSFLKKLLKGNIFDNLVEQRQVIEQINNQLEYRNALLETALTLNHSMVDTTEELIEYHIKSAELLTKVLDLGDGYTDIDMDELMADYEDINKQILDIENQIAELEGNTGNVLQNTWNWISKLWGGSKEDQLKQLNMELENLKEQAEQYEELAELIEMINKLKKQEIEETYKELELKARIAGDEIGVYQARIDYYLEMLRRSEELGLSELEVIEIENKLNETIKERLDYMISHYDKEQDLIIKKAKLSGASEEELNKLRLEALENLIKAKEYEIETLGSTVDRELELVDLELERLALQKEINGELEQQGLLYDKNFRSILRSVIEARKLGDSISENESLIDAIRILVNQGYSINEINRLLGTDFTIDDFPGASEGDYNLPDVNDLINRISDRTSIRDRLSNDIAMDTNRLHIEELGELKEQRRLLSIQNLLLENIDRGVNDRNRTARTNPVWNYPKFNTASEYHRMLDEINRINRK